MDSGSGDGDLEEADLQSLNLYEDVQAQEVEAFFSRVAADAAKEGTATAAGHEEEDDDGDGDVEPPWLKLYPVDDWAEASDAETRAEYIDSLPEDSDRPVADLEDVCSQLVQYLIGHPSSLVTKKRKFPGKGGKSRYFGVEKSEDVMADKFETGCWACGKLTHDSGDCEFKRCFICSQQGHQHWECTLKNLWCKKCSQKGHEQEDCPFIMYDEGIHKREDDDDGEYTDTFFCRCVSCRDDGHLNCAAVPKAVITAPVRPPPVPLRAPPVSPGGPRPPIRPPWQQNPAIRPSLPQQFPGPGRPQAPMGAAIRPVAKWPAPSPPRPSSAPSAEGGWKRPVAKWAAEPAQKRPRIGGTEEYCSDWNGGTSGSQKNGWGSSQGNSWGNSQDNGWGNSQGSSWGNSQGGGWGGAQGRAQQGGKSWNGAQGQGIAKGNNAKGGSRGASQGGGWQSRW